MSDLMLMGVLRAPHDVTDPLGMVQLIDRARQAADEIERLKAENTRLTNQVASFSVETEALIAENERLKREVEVLRVFGNYETLQKHCDDAYFQGGQDMESRLLPKIELLRATIALQDDSISMLETEIERLSAENEGLGGKIQRALDFYYTKDMHDEPVFDDDCVENMVSILEDSCET